MSKPTNQKLSTAMQTQIQTLLENGHSFRETGRLLGISDSTVRKYAAEGGLDLAEQAEGESFLKLARQVTRLQQANKVLNSQNKKLLDRGYGYDDFISSLGELVAIEKKNPFKYHPSKFAAIPRNPKSPVDAKHEEIACLALSDWHISEVVSLADSNGVNVYNSVVGANRLWHIVQRFKQVLAIHQSAFKIKKLWVPALGDMLSGSIHPEFIITNDMSDHAAVLLGARLLIMVLLELLPLGIPIQVDAVVGNHPRTTPKVPTKDIAHSNWDWLMYEYVKMWFAGTGNIDFNIHTSQLAVVKHFDHRYLLEHGIDWKNSREEEFESKLRDLLDDRIYRDATGLTGTAFDQVLIGNLHKPAFMERTIKNGSLIGQNELGQQWRLKPIRAQQLAWGISRSHDRTWQYALDATSVRSVSADNPFSEFATEFVKEHGRYSLLSA